MPDAVRRPWGGKRILTAAAFIIIAALINVAVIKDELLLNGGYPIIMSLDYVSTSSMSRGGYMDLSFKDAGRMAKELHLQNQITGRSHIRDGKAILGAHDDGTYAYANLYTGQTLGEGQVLLSFRLRDNTAVIGGNAFYFKDRFSSSYARAKYASLRVGADGTAIVVGLLDANMELILPD